MAGIFISYRRQDSSGYAGRLYDLLSARFGGENVFMDLDTIQGGEDFSVAIERSIGSCAVLLAVIGERWLTIEGDDGVRRLEVPEDFVRLEIAKAFERGVRVIPILVGKATMPSMGSLPENLHPLSMRQAVELRDGHFRQDATRLTELIADTVPSVRSRFGFRGTKGVALAVSAVLLVGVVVGVSLFRRGATRAQRPVGQASGSVVGQNAAPAPSPAAAPAPSPVLAPQAVAPAKIVPGQGSVVAERAKPPSLGRPSANVVGVWKGTVTYDRPNAMFAEDFSFEVKGSEVSGTATYGQVTCPIVDGKIDGDRLSFTTKTATELDDKIHHDRHSYEGTVEGNTIKFTLITEADYQSHVPVHFTVLRIGD